MESAIIISFALIKKVHVQENYHEFFVESEDYGFYKLETNNCDHCILLCDTDDNCSGVECGNYCLVFCFCVF